MLSSVNHVRAGNGRTQRLSQTPHTLNCVTHNHDLSGPILLCKILQSSNHPVMDSHSIGMLEQNNQNPIMLVETVIREPFICGYQETAFGAGHPPHVRICATFLWRSSNITDIVTLLSQRSHRHLGDVLVNQDLHAQLPDASIGETSSSASTAAYSRQAAMSFLVREGYSFNRSSVESPLASMWTI